MLRSPLPGGNVTSVNFAVQLLFGHPALFGPVDGGGPPHDTRFGSHVVMVNDRLPLSGLPRFKLTDTLIGSPGFCPGTLLLPPGFVHCVVPVAAPEAKVKSAITSKFDSPAIVPVHVIVSKLATQLGPPFGL